MKKSQAAKRYWFNYTANVRHNYHANRKPKLLETIKEKTKFLANLFRGKK